MFVDYYFGMLKEFLMWQRRLFSSERYVKYEEVPDAFDTPEQMTFLDWEIKQTCFTLYEP